MKHRYLFILFLFMTQIGCSQRGIVQTTLPPLTKSQWKEDLHYLAERLPKKHKNVFHSVSKTTFNEAISSLNSDIDHMQDHEIMVRIMQIVAMIGDAHTDLHIPPKAFHNYPFALYWFGNDIRVIRTAEEYQKALGTKVISVGGVSIDEVRSRINTLIPHENDYWQKYISANYIPNAEMLHTLKISADLFSEDWIFENKSGEQFTIRANAIMSPETVKWITVLKEAPLYRQKSSEPIWHTLLAEAQTLYVNFRNYPNASEFKSESKRIIDLIKQGSPKKVVIDFRLNPGGDMLKVQNHLIPELTGFKDLKKGNFYVVIGRATQSAAIANAIDFKKEMNAVLVGEPAGGRPKGYSENNEITLPNSKLTLSCSTRFYTFLDTDEPALMPDKLIEPDWNVYPSGRDLVLEWILQQPVH